MAVYGHFIQPSVEKNFSICTYHLSGASNIINLIRRKSERGITCTKAFNFISIFTFTLSAYVILYFSLIFDILKSRYFIIISRGDALENIFFFYI